MSESEALVRTTTGQWEAGLRASHYQTAEECRDRCRVAHLQPLWDLLPANSRVVEAGCGLGQYVYAFASLGHRCIGLDFSEDLLRRARERGRLLGDLEPLIRWQRGDILDLPMESDTLDCYASFGVLEHFTKSQQRRIMAEAYRILKPGGLLYQYVPNFWSPWTPRRQLRYWFRLVVPPRLVWQRNMRRSTLRNRGSEAGFEPLQIQSVYAEVALRKLSFPTPIQRMLPRPVIAKSLKAAAWAGAWCDSRDILGYGLVYIARKPG